MERFTGPGFSFELGRKTLVMGILNVTPDSFSDGGLFFDPDKALRHALEMQVQGADILDVGAESTRPGHSPVPEEEELRRLIPVLEALRGRLRIPISVDTVKPPVAREVIRRGAAIINDVNGFLAQGMAETVAQGGAACVIMHPGWGPYPKGVAAHVREFLDDAAEKAERAGIPHDFICLDPGVGFGKDTDENLALIRDLEQAKVPGYAYLLGISRKSVIGRSTGVQNPADRLPGTIAAHTIAMLKGADIVRVHDVAEAVQAARLTDAVLGKGAEHGAEE